MLLRYGADPNYTLYERGSVLQTACFGDESQDIEVARLLLAHGANVIYEGGYYGSALQAASCNGDPNRRMVKILLEHGADVNHEGGSYGSAILAALDDPARGHRTFRMLLEHGAIVQTSVLETAARLSRIRALKVLLSYDEGKSFSPRAIDVALEAAQETEAWNLGAVGMRMIVHALEHRLQVIRLGS